MRGVSARGVRFVICTCTEETENIWEIKSGKLSDSSTTVLDGLEWWENPREKSHAFIPLKEQKVSV
jgi:hypothetical protein